MKLPIISAVRATRPHRLAVTWMAGPTATLDLAPIIRRHKSLASLTDHRRFQKVEVGEGGHSVVWGDVDLGADTLWRETQLLAGRADTVDFNDWRMAHGLSLDSAAEALGLSRRMVAYYSSGEKTVPKTTLLACKGWEAEQRKAA